MDLNTVKYSSTAALLLLTILCCYMPWVIKRRTSRKHSKTIMSYLNSLAGGVVLGALLMHMLPELSHHHDHHHHHGEKSSLSTSNRLDDHFHADHAHHDHSHNHDHLHANDSKLHDAHCKCDGTKSFMEKILLAKKFSWGHFFAGASFLLLLAVDRLYMHSHSHDHDHAPSKPVPAHSHHGHDHHHHHHAHSHDHHDKYQDEKQTQPHGPCRSEGNCEAANRVVVTIPEDEECASCHSEDLVGGCHTDGLDSHSTKVQAAVFVVALSMHSFLEGLGMSSKNDRPSLILFLVSLFAHKWLESFALGVNVMNAAFDRATSMILVLFYSFLTPIGMLLGMWVQKYTVGGPYAKFVAATLNGLAVGSFLFVSCIEMIPPEFHKRTRHTVPKFFLLCIGFLTMALLSIFHEC